MTGEELSHELPGFDAVEYETHAQRLFQQTVDSVGTAIR